LSAEPSGSRGPGRAIAAAALVLAGLLVVVALASRGQLGTDAAPGPARPALPSGAYEYVYAALLVFGVLAIPFLFFLYVHEVPYSKARRRRARLAPFALVALAGVALLVATRWGAELRTALDQLQFWQAGEDPGAPGADVRPRAPEWVPMVVVSSAVGAGAVGYLAWRRLRRGRLRPLSLAGRLSGVLDDTLDDVREERDPRRAIILAYARMERALERSGVARHEAEAPLEYVARVLLELDVTAAPVRALADLFEQARFSHHPADETMKQRAIGALETIRAELRELA
jgi:hypothetical protein